MHTNKTPSDMILIIALMEIYFSLFIFYKMLPADTTIKTDHGMCFLKYHQSVNIQI